VGIGANDQGVKLSDDVFRSGENHAIHATERPDRFHHSLSRLTGEQFRFAIARAAIAKRTCSLHSDGCFEKSRQFGRRSGQHKGRTDPYRYANDGAGIRVWVLQYRSDCPQLDGQIFKNVKVPRARLGRKGTHKMGLPIAVAFGDFLLHAAVE